MTDILNHIEWFLESYPVFVIGMMGVGIGALVTYIVVSFDD